MPWLRNATAVENSSSFSTSSTPPTPPTPQSRSFSLRPCLARDDKLARGAADWPLYLHVHADAWVMAQSHRGLLLQGRAFGAAPHPRQLQTRTQGTPDGLHRRHQSRASPPHLALQNRQCSMTPIGTLFWKHHTSPCIAGNA